jgi:hypothetical protein
LAGSIANNESQKIVSAIKEGSITQERSNQLVDEAVNNEIISSDFANYIRTAINKSTPAVSETITEPVESAESSENVEVLPDTTEQQREQFLASLNSRKVDHTTKTIEQYVFDYVDETGAIDPETTKDINSRVEAFLKRESDQGRVAARYSDLTRDYVIAATIRRAASYMERKGTMKGFAYSTSMRNALNDFGRRLRDRGLAGIEVEGDVDADTGATIISNASSNEVYRENAELTPEELATIQEEQVKAERIAQKITNPKQFEQAFLATLSPIEKQAYDYIKNNSNDAIYESTDDAESIISEVESKLGEFAQNFQAEDAGTGDSQASRGRVSGQPEVRESRRELRELFRAGQPIDDYEGRAPDVNWNAVDMYGEVWSEKTVESFVESPHKFIYTSMLDSGDLSPKVVEMETANEIERMNEEQIRSEYPDEFVDEDVSWREVRSRMAEESRNSWESSKQDMARPLGRGYPPAVVRRTGENTFEVIDGNHRIDLWQEQGFTAIPVWVVDDHLWRQDKKRKTPLDTSAYNSDERNRIRSFLENLSQRQSNIGVDPEQFLNSYRQLPEEFKRAIEYTGRAKLYRGTENEREGKTEFPEAMTFTTNEGYAKFMGTFQITNTGLPQTGTIDSKKVVQMLGRRANKQFEKDLRDSGFEVGDDEGEVIILNDKQERIRQALRGIRTAGMTTDAVRARLEALGFGVDGMIRIVEDPQAAFEGRVIIRDGKAVRIDLNAAALKDDAAIERVLNHEFAEAANADGALDQLISNLSQTERDTIQSDITRLGYAESVRNREAAARGVERLVNSWRGRNWFERAVGRVLAWANKAGLPMTRLAAESIAARAVAEVDADVRKWTIADAMGKLPGARRVTIDGREAVLIPPGQMAVAQSIAAYHGTPHEIKDRFLIEKVGTGEGATAYGWGLYFAENIEVAREYKEKLTRRIQDPIRINGETINRGNLVNYDDQINKDAYTGLIKIFQNNKDASFSGREQAAQYLESINMQREADAIRASNIDFSGGVGNLYTVELDADTDQLLDWDKPLGEQSDKVKAAFSVRAKRGMNSTYKKAFKKIWPFYLGDERTIRDIYKQFSFDIGSEKDASDFLNGMGIPGIRYLDRGSRADGKGTYNYVIFDENIIKITAENGVPVSMGEARESRAFVAPESDNIALSPESVFSPEQVARHTDLEAKHDAGTITPEETAEAQRMVDEAARAAGYRIRAYHGTPTGGFTEFKTSYQGRTGGRARGGFSFTNNPKAAEAYAKSFSDESVALDEAIRIANQALRSSKDQNSLGVFFEDQGFANADVPEFYWGAIDDNSEFAGSLREWAAGLDKTHPGVSSAFRQAASILETDFQSAPEVKNVFLSIPENAQTLNATPETLGEVVAGLDVREVSGKAAIVNMPNGEQVFYVADPTQIKSAEPFTGVSLDQRFDTGNDIRGNIDFAANPVNQAEPTREGTLTDAARRLRYKRESGSTTLLTDIPEAVWSYGKEVYRQGQSFVEWAGDMLAKFGESVQQFLSAMWDGLTGGNLLPHARQRGSVGTGVTSTPAAKPAKVVPPEKGTQARKTFNKLDDTIRVIQRNSNSKAGDRPRPVIGQMVSDYLVATDVDATFLANRLEKEGYYGPETAKKLAAIIDKVKQAEIGITQTQKEIRARMDSMIPAETNREKALKEKYQKVAEIAGTISQIAADLDFIYTAEPSQNKEGLIRKRLAEAKRIVRLIPKEYQGNAIPQLVRAANSAEQLRELVDLANEQMEIARTDQAYEKAKETLAKGQKKYKKLSQENRELLAKWTDQFTAKGMSVDTRERLERILEDYSTNPQDAWLGEKAKLDALRESGEAGQSKLASMLKRAEELEKMSLRELRNEQGRVGLDTLTQGINAILHKDRNEKGERAVGEYKTILEQKEAFLKATNDRIGLTRRGKSGDLELPKQWKAGMTTMRSESALNILGDPVLHEIAYLAMIDGYRNQLEMEQRFKNELKAYVLDKTGYTIGEKDFQLWSDEIVLLTGYNSEGTIKGKVKLTRRELWDIAAMLRDPDNLKQAALVGEKTSFVVDSQRLQEFSDIKFTPELLAEIDSLLGDGADNTVVDFLHKVYSRIGDEVLPVVEWVKGSTPERRVSYHPRERDPDTRKVWGQTIEDMQGQMDNQMNLTAGFLKETSPNAKAKLVIRDSIVRFGGHLSSAARVKAYMEPATHAVKVLQDAEVIKRIRDRIGQEGYDLIFRSTLAQALPTRRDVGGKTFMDVLADRINEGMVASMLGLKLGATLMNPSGIPIGVSYLSGPVGDYVLKGSATAWGNRKKNLQALNQFSPYFRERYGLNAGFAQEYTDGAWRRDTAKFKGNNQMWYMAPIEFTDKIGGVYRAEVIREWMKGERKDLKEDTDAWNEEFARQWELMMFRSENTSHGADRTALLQKAANDRWFGTLVMFTSSVSKIMSAQLEAVAYAQMAAYSNDPTQKAESSEKAKKLMSGFLTSAVMGATIRAAIDVMMEEPDEEKDMLTIAREYVAKIIGGQLLGSIPLLGGTILGPLATSAITGENVRPFSLSTWDSLAQSTYRTAAGLYKTIEAGITREVNEKGELVVFDEFWKTFRAAADPVGVARKLPLPAIRQYYDMSTRLLERASKPWREGSGNLSNEELNAAARKSAQGDKETQLTDEYSRILRAVRRGDERGFRNALKDLEAKRPSDGYKEIRRRIEGQYSGLRSIEAGRAQVNINTEALNEIKRERQAMLESLNELWMQRK